MAGQQHSDRAEVGELMAAMRAERKLSPAELARRADVDVKTVRNLENGTRWPQDVTRAKLEKALGVRPGLIRDLLDGREERARVRNALRHGELSTWPRLLDGEVNTDESEQADVPSEAGGANAAMPITVLDLGETAAYAGSVAELLRRVDLAATDMDPDTRTLLTRAQVRTVAFLYTLVAGADDVDAAVVQAASAAERLGGDALFRDGMRTALEAIAQLSRTHRVQLTGTESADDQRTPDRDAIDVAIPGGRGHVFLKLVNDKVSEIKLHDTPPAHTPAGS